MIVEYKQRMQVKNDAGKPQPFPSIFVSYLYTLQEYNNGETKKDPYRKHK